MRFKLYLPIICLTLTSIACVNKIERVVHQETIAPEFTIEKERLESRITTIVPAKEVNITSSTTTSTGKPKLNTLHVEILDPENFPANGFTFSELADDIKVTVEESIGNIGDFDKMKVVVRTDKLENGTSHNRSFTREIDL